MHNFFLNFWNSKLLILFKDGGKCAQDSFNSMTTQFLFVNVGLQMSPLKIENEWAMRFHHTSFIIILPYSPWFKSSLLYKSSQEVSDWKWYLYSYHFQKYHCIEYVLIQMPIKCIKNFSFVKRFWLHRKYFANFA